MKKLKSLRLWFAGLRSWDRYWLYGLGAVLALSIALLYGKATNSDAADELARVEAQEKAEKRRADKDSPSNTVWDRFIHHPRRLTIMILAGLVVIIVWRVIEHDWNPRF